MTAVLILLTFPEEIRAGYLERLQARFPQVRFDLVDHHAKVDPLIDAAEVLITFPLMLTDEVLARACRLRWVQSLGTGVDNLVDLPSLRPEVVITNVRGIHGPPVSESAILSMLALSRQLPRSIRAQDARRWERWPSTLIDGKTVGILGVGAIAGDLAVKCQALGMRVIGISSTPERMPEGFDEMRSRADLAAATADLDFLVLLTPLTARTRHLVGAEVFAAMKPSSFLVNLARGGVVAEDDLVAALEAGRIAGAALDVFEEEPLPEGHPLWTAKNVILTPHLAGFHTRYIDDVLPIVIHNMTCFLDGTMDEMIYVVKRG